MLQFKDLNADKSAFQRTYANQVKRCDEMARRLRFFSEQVLKANMTIKPRPEQDVKTYHFDELEVGGGRWGCAEVKTWGAAFTRSDWCPFFASLCG